MKNALLHSMKNAILPMRVVHFLIGYDLFGYSQDALLFTLRYFRAQAIEYADFWRLLYMKQKIQEINQFHHIFSYALGVVHHNNIYLTIHAVSK